MDDRRTVGRCADGTRRDPPTLAVRTLRRRGASSATPLDDLAIGQLLHLDLPDVDQTVVAVISRFGPPDLVVIAEGALEVSTGDDVIVAVHVSGSGEILFKSEILGEELTLGAGRSVRLSWPNEYFAGRQT